MNIDVGAYIADLLYENNTVHIPGMGGFVTKYKPASVDPVQGELAAPSKGLNFNDNLAIDDGLLVNYVREKHNITLSEARKAVEAYVQEVQAAIGRREIVVFPKVGRLYKDYENKLQFLADSTNFNIDAFGLPAVHFFPVARAERTAAQPAGTVAPSSRPVQPNFFQRLLNNGLVIAIGGALIVVMVAVYFLFFYGKAGQKENVQLLPTSRINVSPSTNLPADPLIDEGELEEDTYAGDDGLEEAGEDAATDAATPAPNQRYFVISIGVFGNEENIQRLIERIYQAGYEPFTEKKGSLTRVGIQKAYQQKREVEAALEEVRQLFSKDATIYKQ